MSQISYFNSLPTKGQPHVSSGTMSITDFLHGIKFGKWKDAVAKIRGEQDKEKRNLLKKNLVSVTVSGVFNERKENLIIAHSGFICIDVDNYTDKSAIIKDPYTYACFTSASGNGFAVIVRVKPETHKECFRWIQKYYFESFGIVVDPAPQNPASIRYISFDPEVESNEKSKQAPAYKEKKKEKPQSLPFVITGNKVEEYIQQVVARGVDIAPTYLEYLNLSFALADGFQEQGRAYFHTLCSLSPKYSSQHADKQYDIALKRGKHGIGVGTFYWMLKQAGIEVKGDPQTTKVISIAALAKRDGREKSAVIEQLTTINNIPQQEAIRIVEEAFNRPDITVKTLSSTPEDLIENLVEWVKLNHPMRKNEITGMVEEGGKELTEERLNTIFLRAKKVFNDNSVTFELLTRIVHSEFTPSYNPITKYIDENRWRKSYGNIDALAATITSNTPHYALFIRKWIISVIAAHHGHPVRSVLCLIGTQNTGKTYWFRKLLPEKLMRYYGESKLDAGKDDELLMCQKLVLVDDEMSGKSKEDEKRFKELTSKSIFSLRAPYGRHNQDYKRLAILGGTSNSKDIVNDRTGNTRMLPVEVISINHAAYNKIDKDELFMEAVRAIEAGEAFELTRDELAHLAVVSEEFDSINFEREIILKFFSAPVYDGYHEYMTATDIKNYIETNSRQQIKNLKLFGAELRRIFGSPVQKSGLGRVYKLIKLSAVQTSNPTLETPGNVAASAAPIEKIEENTNDIITGPSDGPDLW